VGKNPSQELYVGGATIPREQATTAYLFDGFPDSVNAVRAEAGQRIGHSFGPAATPQQALADLAGPASRARRLFGQRCIGAYHIRARLDPLQHSGEMFRIIAEISLQRNDHVSLRVIRSAAGFSEQQLEGGRVATPAIEVQNAQGENALVRREDVGRFVAGSVVGYEDLVVTRKTRHDLANLPQNHPDCALLVVRGDTDVNHVT
jgi:hypothetical protein